MIYGIMGGKGHGKDTFAKLVCTSNNRSSRRFRIYHFADPLKDLCAEILGLSREAMDDPERKEALLMAPILLDSFVGHLSRKTGLEVLPRGKVAHTIREALQFVGTDYVRAIDPEYWIRSAAEELQRMGGNVLVPDARFANEAEALRKMGGRIIRVHRVDMPPSGDDHASETEGAKVVPDLSLGVRTGDLSLLMRVATLVSLGKVAYLGRYDYPRVQGMLQMYGAGETIAACTQHLGIQNNDSEAFRFLLHYYGVPTRKPGVGTNPHRFQEGTEEKNCQLCKQWRPLERFSRCARGYDGLHSVCKECTSTEHRRRYAAKGNVLRLEEVFKRSKVGAGRRGIEFCLTFEEVRAQWEKQEGRCAYLGDPLVLGKNSPLVATLDRLDPSRGYAPGNIVFCSFRVNMMKRDMTLEEFGAVVSKLAARRESFPPGTAASDTLAE